MKLFISIVLVLNMFLKKLKNLLGDKNIIANIFRTQSNNLVICGYFCNGFINVMLAGKILVDFTGLFPPYDFEKKWQYNFELLETWMKLIKQTWMIKQNSD